MNQHDKGRDTEHSSGPTDNFPREDRRGNQAKLKPPLQECWDQQLVDRHRYKSKPTSTFKAGNCRVSMTTSKGSVCDSMKTAAKPLIHSLTDGNKGIADSNLVGPKNRPLQTRRRSMRPSGIPKAHLFFCPSRDLMMPRKRSLFRDSPSGCPDQNLPEPSFLHSG